MAAQDRTSASGATPVGPPARVAPVFFNAIDLAAPSRLRRRARELLDAAPADQKFIVSCVHTPNVGPYRQFDSLHLELFGGGRTTNSARVHLACVFGNRSLLPDRAPGEPFADLTREGLDIFRIE